MSMSEEILDLTVKETYDENQIQVLEGLEAVASARACTLARLLRAACTIWCMKSWIIPSMKHWRATMY